MWEMLMWCKGNYNIITMTQTGTTLSAPLTDKDLALSGIYKMQLLGTIGDEVRHSNVIYVDIPSSIDGDINWPEVPTVFQKYLQQVQGFVSEAQTYAGSAQNDATSALQAAQTATETVAHVQDYIQTASNEAARAEDAAQTATAAENEAEQHAASAETFAQQAAQSATQTADKIPLSQKGTASGVATLDSDGTLPTQQLPIIPINLGGTGATTAEQAIENLNIVPQTSTELIKPYTHTKNGSTHNLTGPAGAAVIQFSATADYNAGDTVAVNGVTLLAADLRGMSLPDKAFVSGANVLALVSETTSGGSITFQILPSVSNPNLLDNWYFAGGGSQQGGGQLPINQRGQTSYTGNGAYAIDRWMCASSATLSFSQDSIVLTADDSTYGIIRQFLEPTNFLLGRTVTASVMLSNNGLYSFTANIPTEMSSGNLNLAQKSYTSGNFSIWFYNGKIMYQLVANAGETIQIVAAKLELGSAQTLASQDSEGNWVLNDPPPNFQQELAKCQRYQLVLSSTDSNSGVGVCSVETDTSAQALISLPITMRSKPAVTYTGNWGVLINGSINAVSAISMVSINNNAIICQLTANGLAAGSCGILRCNSDTNAKIIFDANL